LGGKVCTILAGGHSTSLGRHRNRFLVAVAVIAAAGTGGVASVGRREPVVTVSCQPAGCVGKPVYHHQRLTGSVSVAVAVAKAGSRRWKAGGWVEHVLRQEGRS
jgi:aspartate aminotransferase-like enzyme